MFTAPVEIQPIELMDVSFTPLDNIEAPSSAKDFVEGFAIGIGTVAAIVGIIAFC